MSYLSNRLVCGAVAALARLLPERDPHPSLYEVTLFVLGFLDDPTVWPALYVRWELALLDELGFGLDLTACAATGRNDRLIYVSPKSGRAVSRAAGAAWHDRLLALPGFLAEGRSETSARELAAGFALTEFFLARHLFEQRGVVLPDTRAHFLNAVLRSA